MVLLKPDPIFCPTLDRLPEKKFKIRQNANSHCILHKFDENFLLSFCYKKVRQNEVTAS